MTNRMQQILRVRIKATTAAMGLVVMLVFAGIATESAQAQTFTVLYTFTNTANGEQPDTSLILDSAGNLYGTTQNGGTKGGFGTYSS